MSFTYLCSPYSALGADQRLRHERFELACRAAWKLMRAGENIFTPIGHSHSVELCSGESPEGHDFWLKQDFAIMRHCALAKVLMLDGWRESVGISREIRLLNHMGIPIEYMEPV